MTPDQAAVFADTRLSREARFIGLYIAALGGGPVEIAHDTFRQLLGRGGTRGGLAKDDTIAGYISELVTLGWVSQDVNTGRGHSPSYTFSPPSQGGVNAELAPLLRRGLNLAPTLEGEPKTDRPYPQGGSKRPPSPSPVTSSSSSEETREEFGIEERAEEAIQHAAGKLNGCRGSLRDYLSRRVEPRYQLGYVQRVVTSLDGADEWMWSDRTGKRLVDGRTKILAAAFNELLSAREVGEHFSDPRGGFGNLRSKVRYLVASALGVENDANKRNSSRTPGPAGSKPGARAERKEVHVEG